MALKQLWCETAVSRACGTSATEKATTHSGIVRTPAGTHTGHETHGGTGEPGAGTHGTHGSARTSQTTRPAPRPRSRPNSPFFCTTELDKNTMKHEVRKLCPSAGRVRKNGALKFLVNRLLPRRASGYGFHFFRLGRRWRDTRYARRRGFSGGGQDARPDPGPA